MTIALLVITDGRVDCIPRTIESAATHTDAAAIAERWIYDDSGDHDHRQWLARSFPDFHILWHPGGRQGFGGAIRAAWDWLTQLSRADFIFHLEDDFTFNRDVDLQAMADTLDRHPELVHLALRRQPWNEAELVAGGVVEQHPHDFVERSDGTATWLEHRRFFSTNPSLYRRSLLARGWPEGAQSEGRFSLDLFSDPDARCGYWGSRDSGEAVHHIGHERVGHGY